MIKNLLYKVLIVVFSSFFFINVNAVTEVALDNLSYANYLNIYNLQYDDRDIAQKYYNFLINTNLHDFIFANLKEFKLDSDSAPGYNQYINYNQEVNNPYFISLLGLSATNNLYDLSNGIYLNLYLPFSRTGFNEGIFTNFSYLDSSGTIFNLHLQAYDTVALFKLNLYLDDDGSFKIKPVIMRDYVHSVIIDLTLQNPIQFLGAFYQSSFTLNYKDNTANVPVGFTSFHFYNDLNNYYTSKDFKYLAYNYFDHNVYFGAGVPLYPAYSIFSNSFEFGDPYTSDFNHLYFGNQECYFAPTSKLLNDYDSIHNSGDDNLWFTFNDNMVSIDNLFSKRFSFSYFSISDLNILNSSYSYSGDTDFIKKFDVSLKIDVYSNGKFYKLSPYLINLNSILRFSAGDSNHSLSIYYKKDLWNYTCATGSNEFTLDLGDGSNFTGNNGSLTDSSSDNVLTSLIDSVGNFFGSFLSYFINFISSLSGLAKLVIDCFVSLFNIFGSFFIFVGNSIFIMFSCFPSVVVETFKIIIIFTSLIVVFKFIIGR